MTPHTDSDMDSSASSAHVLRSSYPRSCLRCRVYDGVGVSECNADWVGVPSSLDLNGSASLCSALRYGLQCTRMDSSDSPPVLRSSDPSAHHLSELPLRVSCSSQLDCNFSEFRCYHPGHLVELMSRSTFRIKPAAGEAVGRGRRTQPPAFLPTNFSIDPPWLANHAVTICHPQVPVCLTYGGRQCLSGCPGSGSQCIILILSWASSFGDFIKSSFSRYYFQGISCSCFKARPVWGAWCTVWFRGSVLRDLEMEFAVEEFITIWVSSIDSQRARVLQYFIIHGGRSQVWGNRARFSSYWKEGNRPLSRTWSSVCLCCYCPFGDWGVLGLA